MYSNRSLSVAKRMLRCMSSASNSSLVKSTGSSEKFVIVDGKFKRIQGDNVPTVKEEITHTGQYFDDGDWRRNRFMDRSKMVNRNWAVEMIDEIPPIEVEGRVASCEGRDGPDAPAALGHPKVYINLDKGKAESCLYCGLRYIRKAQHH